MLTLLSCEQSRKGFAGYHGSPLCITIECNFMRRLVFHSHYFQTLLHIGKKIIELIAGSLIFLNIDLKINWNF